jgi:hypothetical protein
MLSARPRRSMTAERSAKGMTMKKATVKNRKKELTIPVLHQFVKAVSTGYFGLTPTLGADETSIGETKLSHPSGRDGRVTQVKIAYVEADAELVSEIVKLLCTRFDAVVDDDSLLMFRGKGGPVLLKAVQSVYGIDLVGIDCTLVKRTPFVVCYMMDHEVLQGIEQQCSARQWHDLRPSEKIECPVFVIDGTTDTKVRNTQWVDDAGFTRIIALDQSTGILSLWGLKKQ